MLDTILKQIDLVYAKIQQNRENPAGLLEAANSLATLMYNLGNLYITAREAKDRAEVAHKDMVDDLFLGMRAMKDLSIEEAKVEARKSSREAYKTFLEAERMELKIGTLRKDISLKISTIQSYASEVRNRKSFNDL